MKTTKTSVGTRSEHKLDTRDRTDSSLNVMDLSKLINMKEQEVKQLQQKEEKICQIEVLCQREKEFLLDKYKHALVDRQDGTLTDDQGGIDKPMTMFTTANRSHDEVYKLVSQIHHQKQENKKLLYKIREAEAMKDLKDVYNSMTKQKQGDTVCPGSLLFKWFKIAQESQSSKSNGSLQGHTDSKLSLADKLFYHVKYQDLTQKDLDHSTASSRLTCHTRQGPENYLEMVSFNTRHNGVCVGVIVAKVEEKITREKNNLQTKTSNNRYIIITNPYIDNSEDALDFIHHGKPIEFVQQVVWKYI